MSQLQLTAAGGRVNPDAWVRTVRSSWQNAGHRMTEPRTRVLERIAGYTTPFTAEQLYADLQADGHAPGRATVYRTLEQLHTEGWVARIHSSGLDTGYIASWPGHMHHLVCTNCGVVVAFEGCFLGDMMAKLASETNFTIDGHLLQLYGRCIRCQRV
ncbi:MAG: transcriptional repressor [Chloroflexaceae bacterium]|jgi:Fur family ferric uptake transcriptional regulator|nr:transcriptional repressor [Chloroflexaceae bacterium]